MSKIRLPKCPYCKAEYKEQFGDTTLSNLACYGWENEAKVKCYYCGRKYKITVKIMYYGSKINEVENDE